VVGGAVTVMGTAGGALLVDVEVADPIVAVPAVGVVCEHAVTASRPRQAANTTARP
jgi:hypothetical protein